MSKQPSEKYCEGRKNKWQKLPPVFTVYSSASTLLDYAPKGWKAERDYCPSGPQEIGTVKGEQRKDFFPMLAKDKIKNKDVVF
ncbi:hypothetical protein TNIN_394951 [Trichonephila inaurata madagascariensis]|uniref:Uncharacterized protein n=1 Tax=Trichonephila inaurata madagascariensis TaxID=2747483 RepID=A0A8X6IJW5_9ARAC|nr:hypothetical protein TNIN_394951 [Trichonephila inaurata madagascariensis]